MYNPFLYMTVFDLLKDFVSRFTGVVLLSPMVDLMS